jgi:hypothetical protein
LRLPARALECFDQLRWSPHSASFARTFLLMVLTDGFYKGCIPHVTHRDKPMVFTAVTHRDKPMVLTACTWMCPRGWYLRLRRCICSWPVIGATPLQLESTPIGASPRSSWILRYRFVSRRRCCVVDGGCDCECETESVSRSARGSASVSTCPQVGCDCKYRPCRCRQCECSQYCRCCECRGCDLRMSP